MFDSDGRRVFAPSAVTRAAARVANLPEVCVTTADGAALIVPLSRFTRCADSRHNRPLSAASREIDRAAATAAMRPGALTPSAWTRAPPRVCAPEPSTRRRRGAARRRERAERQPLAEAASDADADTAVGLRPAYESNREADVIAAYKLMKAAEAALPPPSARVILSAPAARFFRLSLRRARGAKCGAAAQPGAEGARSVALSLRAIAADVRRTDMAGLTGAADTYEQRVALRSMARVCVRLEGAYDGNSDADDDSDGGDSNARRFSGSSAGTRMSNQGSGFFTLDLSRSDADAHSVALVLRNIDSVAPSDSLFAGAGDVGTPSLHRTPSLKKPKSPGGAGAPHSTPSTNEALGRGRRGTLEPPRLLTKVRAL